MPPSRSRTMEKRMLFESLRFENGGAGEPFDLGERQVETLHLELP